MVRNYTDKQLLNRVREVQNFRGIPSGYWIIGVRSNEDTSDRFDDKFYLFNGTIFISVMSGTTNPGKKVLLNYFRYNRKGAFVLKSDFWHHNIWQYGLHRGKMPGLKQVGLVYGYRDNNKDLKTDETGPLYKGYFGINFHKANYGIAKNFKRLIVGGWSAGCQVANDSDKYDRWINILKHSDRISYCLLNEF